MDKDTTIFPFGEHVLGLIFCCSCCFRFPALFVARTFVSVAQLKALSLLPDADVAVMIIFIEWIHFLGFFFSRTNLSSSNNIE